LQTLRGEKWLLRACGGSVIVNVGVHTGLGARLSVCGWADRRFAKRESSEAGFEVWFSTSIEVIVSANEVYFRLHIADAGSLR
jgi:hypothetical protein